MKKIEAIIKPFKLDEVIEKNAKTGKIGDGKIFVSAIEDAIRIRTGERGEEAIR
ncbi:MAG: hypothetical protein L0Y62_01880 [Nitrospirae bacterium]|nr:hypothetical protein [Nitrospirota bacterium]